MLSSDQAHLSKIRILLADDHHRVRKQLSARLSRETDFEVAGVTLTSRATLLEARATHPHILLMDPFMRDGLGLATLRQVRVSIPELVIVVLTAYVDTVLKIQFQQMGIRHVLTKGTALSHLLSELRAAYQSSYSPDVG